MRIESDFLGPREIPDDVYYGVQTLRGKENFIITGVGISAEPRLVVALAYVKKACAMANRDLGLLAPVIADAIGEARKITASVRPVSRGDSGTSRTYSTISSSRSSIPSASSAHASCSLRNRCWLNQRSAESLCCDRENASCS